ncbi:PQQ-dependent sugar dehydrogenase [Oceanihabitans sp. 2_MG-2023]|uniref:PQQ-dependent sugar dehydrogenase n=1 Tax=Oceanihabitans sp. 2_MG-2023 TaxID=3062661 RepID=UPI0026E21A63|nr:PQQ-dependent sugar dehydrogenase [Oceanihabitans sp. 2_MG-2023]MDO6597894.1 PQQ-dependent sugar dehydrogenase [Oceanihabitans sp. 2_MG-2023]
MKKNYLFTLLFSLLFSLTFSQVLPEGFALVEVTDKVENASCFAFIDENNILIAKQNGEIYLHENGVTSAEPIVYIPTINSTISGDRGLASIAVDPDYPSSPYVYITYTVEESTNNVVSRFNYSNGVFDLSSELVLLELSPILYRWHVGGAIVFDDAGHLFTTTGDNSIPNNAQDINTTHGKVLRINKDGTIPTDNPYYGSGGVSDLFWGIGLRNPYTMAIHKATNTIYINDVGQVAWEEINNATVANRNFGWPNEEGPNSTATSIYDEPSYAYAHPGVVNDITGYAITGGAFYDPLVPKYPNEYVNKYFFLEFSNQWINIVDPYDDLTDGHTHIHDLTSTRETFATGIPRGGIYLTTSPDGYLYFFSRIDNILYKIEYTDTDIPVIIQQEEDTVTMDGERTTFNVVAAGAPDLTYQWYKNGTIISNAPNAAIYRIWTTTMASAGTYQARVFNSYGEVWSETFELTVIPFNESATVTVTATSPVNGSMYQAGETINFSATATDPEMGVIPASNYTWFVEFHHNDHLHDGPAFATGVDSGTFVIPDVGEIASDVWYKIIAKVTDDIDQESEGFAEVFPLKTDITFATQPAGLEVSIDGPGIVTPFTETFVEHLRLPIGAPSQTVNGTDGVYRLNYWSETVTNDLYLIPEEETTLTAVFELCTNPDNIPTLTYTESIDGIEFNWNTTSTACNQGFTLENMDSLETYTIFANNVDSDYSQLVNNLVTGTQYNFRVQAYNEYGVSDYTYITFTLGVDNFSAFNGIRVYPNPVNNYFNIEGLNENEEYTLNLYSLLGQSVENFKTNSIEGTHLEYDMSKLESGIYFLKVSVNGKNKTFKIIKE